MSEYGQVPPNQGAPFPPGGGVPPYGAYGQSPGPVVRPRSVSLAVAMMYVGAGLSVLALLVTIVLRVVVDRQVQDAGSSGTDAEGAFTIALVVVAVSAVVGAVLWLLMAWANGKGRKWARIFATVLFVLNVLFTASALARPRAAGSIIVSVIMITVGGFIIFLLFRPESSRYYDAASRAGS